MNLKAKGKKLDSRSKREKWYSSVDAFDLGLPEKSSTGVRLGSSRAPVRREGVVHVGERKRHEAST